MQVLGVTTAGIHAGTEVGWMCYPECIFYNQDDHSNVANSEWYIKLM